LGKIAIAMASGAIVVTRNRVDFGKIVGLKIEGWAV
jgi:predicted nucleic acid-binding protein